MNPNYNYRWAGAVITTGPTLEEVGISERAKDIIFYAEENKEKFKLQPNEEYELYVKLMVRSRKDD